MDGWSTKLPGDLCTINFCSAVVGLLRAPNYIATGLDARCFCEAHGTEFSRSPEGERCRVAAREGRLTQPLLVSALCDFRTRVELEHQRDHDPIVRQARGET